MIAPSFLTLGGLPDIHPSGFGILDFINRCWLIFDVLLFALLDLFNVFFAVLFLLLLDLFNVFFVILLFVLLNTPFTPALKPVFSSVVLMKLRMRLSLFTFRASFQNHCSLLILRYAPTVSGNKSVAISRHAFATFTISHCAPMCVRKSMNLSKLLRLTVP